MFRQRQNKRIVADTRDNNRLYVILAIIFLLSFLIIFRLYNLQVFKYDWYITLASDQHQVLNQLLPDRGEIFLHDSPNFDDQKYYPVATNKEFGLLYAVPSKIEASIDPEIANKLYDMFDQERIEKEVDKMLETDPFFASTSELTVAEYEKRMEFKKVKKEVEVGLKKEEEIKKYLEKLGKKNDPYEPLVKKVPEEKLAEIDSWGYEGLGHIMETFRYYPEGKLSAHILGFVGYSGDDVKGNYGLEGFFDEELAGVRGSIKTERSAQGEPIIIDDREYQKALDGSDLYLTINRTIQFEACKHLSEACEAHQAEACSVIVMEPKTGAILAMCSWPEFDPNNYNEVESINVYNNVGIFSPYEPGSVFKVITMASGIDQGKVEPTTTYNDTGFVMIADWPKPIKNSDYESFGAHGWVDMVKVLELSLNTGAIFVMEQMGSDVFADYVEKFGFGEKTGIELATEAGTNISSLTGKRIGEVEAATASFGQGITVTPLQMVSSYAAIANGGILMQPYLVSKIVSPDGSEFVTQPKEIRRVISERAAILTLGMMVNVIDRGHSTKAAVEGYYIGGKTGTAQVARTDGRGYSDKTIHTFVGVAPVEDPKFVMLVRVDNPKDVRYADSSAAPIFSKIAKFILDYYQVPKER